jgi:hypothetical protein
MTVGILIRGNKMKGRRQRRAGKNKEISKK